MGISATFISDSSISVSGEMLLERVSTENRPSSKER
jgi:hypothetical protein